MDNAVNLYQRLNSKLFELLSSLSLEQLNKNVSGESYKVRDIVIQLLEESSHNLSLFNQKFYSNTADLKQYKDHNIQFLLADLQSVQDLLSPYFNGFFNPTVEIEKNVVAIGLLEFYAKNWLLQQKMRQALGKNLLLEADFYLPFLEFCMRFLPQHLKRISFENDTLISISIVSETSRSWQIICKGQIWELTEPQEHSDTQVYIDQNIAWILFSGGVDIYEASQYWQIIGNQEFGRHVLSMRTFQ